MRACFHWGDVERENEKEDILELSDSNVNVFFIIIFFCCLYILFPFRTSQYLLWAPFIPHFVLLSPSVYPVVSRKTRTRISLQASVCWFQEKEGKGRGIYILHINMTTRLMGAFVSCSLSLSLSLSLYFNVISYIVCVCVCVCVCGFVCLYMCIECLSISQREEGARKRKSRMLKRATLHSATPAELKDYSFSLSLCLSLSIYYLSFSFSLSLFLLSNHFPIHLYL